MDRDRRDLRALIESGELWPLLVSVAARRMRLPRDHPDVQDIVQESIVSAIMRQDSIRENARSYVTKIVVNKARRWTKERGKVTDVGEHEAVAVDRKAQEPSAIAARNELCDRLGEAVSQLSKSDQALLHQRFERGETLQKIAEKLGIDGGTVSRRLVRLAKRLRKQLGNDSGD